MTPIVTIIEDIISQLSAFFFPLVFPLREKIKTEARETEPNIVIANLWEI